MVRRSTKKTNTKTVTPMSSAIQVPNVHEIAQAVAQLLQPAPQEPTRVPLEQVFRDRLREHLARKRWSQKDLATALGVDQTRVSHLILGHRTPAIETLEKLGDALEIEPMELLDRRSLFR